MALTNDTVLDIDKDKDDGQELKFQDFGDSNLDADADGKTHTFNNYPSDNEDEEDNTELLTGRKKDPSFWTFEYYQTFFDVETYQVFRRLLASFIPKPNKNSISDIRPNPDLYGPFWVCITLVFTTAITGDMANYFRYTDTSQLVWKPDFKKVSIAATAIFCYWWLIASMVWGMLSWRRSQAGYTYLEIICVYGYSLTIYIPVSFLYVIPVEWVQWALMCLALVLSGSVLVLTFWPAVKDDDKKFAIGILAGIFIFHALLAVGFKFYFFKAPELQHSSIPVTHAAIVPAHPTEPFPPPDQLKGEANNFQQPGKTSSSNPNSIVNSGQPVGVIQNQPVKPSVKAQPVQPVQSVQSGQSGQPVQPVQSGPLAQRIQQPDSQLNNGQPVNAPQAI